MMGRERSFPAQGRWLRRCHLADYSNAPVQRNLMGIYAYAFLSLAFVSLHPAITSAQESCVAAGDFQDDTACSQHTRAMFEGWFGRRTSAYCSERFPEVGILGSARNVCILYRGHLVRSGCAVLQVWTDFVDCFVDSVLAKGQTVPARYSPQVSFRPAAAPGRLDEQESCAGDLTTRDTIQEEVRPTFLPAVPRLVAIGDLHGDMQKARRAFRLGGLVDASDRWAGGTTTAVQVLLCFDL